MTSRVEWKNEQSLEARALYALWRNHPLTAVKDRGGERAHRMARANRDMLLSWAAAQPDYRLRDCRNIGAATLAWIRANQSPTPTGLNVDDLTRFIDDALEDWSTRPDPEPSAQVAVYLARRIAENIVTPPPAGRDAVRMRGLFGGETEARATEWVLRIEAEARAPLDEHRGLTVDEWAVHLRSCSGCAARWVEARAQLDVERCRYCGKPFNGKPHSHGVRYLPRPKGPPPPPPPPPPTPGPQYTEDDPDWSAMVSPISDTDGGHDDR